MTPFEQSLQWLVRNWRLDIAILAKSSVLLFLFLYICFSLVVVRQVQLMNRAVNGMMSQPLLMLLSCLLVILAAAAFILGLWIL